MDQSVISTSCFSSRCQYLSAQLQPRSVAIVSAALPSKRGWDTHHAFWQDSDFYYLSGLNEPGAVLLVFSSDLGARRILFCRPSDPAQEQWEGARLGVLGAQAIFDYAFSLDELFERLPHYLADVSIIYCSNDTPGAMMEEINQVIIQAQAGTLCGQKPIESLLDLRSLIHRSRLIKDVDEIHCIQQAVDRSVVAHQECMRRCQPGMHEYELEALFYQQVRQAGSDHHLAYNSIVGSGERACVLHYTANNSLLLDGEMVLIDAGASYQHYAADITRTYPINGQFNRDQAALYQAVLDVQLAVIDVVKPGVDFNYLQLLTKRLITEQLLVLGLLSGDLDVLIEENACHLFYPHGVGHWLGLDVHDPCPLKDDQGWLSFKPGMVLTVEPGLYIPHGIHSVDDRWWGMGIRIEDDVLVTNHGCDVLSSGVPKHRSDIEALMAGN